MARFMNSRDIKRECIALLLLLVSTFGSFEYPAFGQTITTSATTVNPIGDLEGKLALFYSIMVNSGAFETEVVSGQTRLKLDREGLPIFRRGELYTFVGDLTDRDSYGALVTLVINQLCDKYNIDPDVHNHLLARIQGNRDSNQERFLRELANYEFGLENARRGGMGFAIGFGSETWVDSRLYPRPGGRARFASENETIKRWVMSFLRTNQLNSDRTALDQSPTRKGEAPERRVRLFTTESTIPGVTDAFARYEAQLYEKLSRILTAEPVSQTALDEVISSPLLRLMYLNQNQRGAPIGFSAALIEMVRIYLSESQSEFQDAAVLAGSVIEPRRKRILEERMRTQIERVLAGTHPELSVEHVVLHVLRLLTPEAQVFRVAVDGGRDALRLPRQFDRYVGQTGRYITEADVIRFNNHNADRTDGSDPILSLFTHGMISPKNFLFLWPFMDEVTREQIFGMTEADLVSRAEAGSGVSSGNLINSVSNWQSMTRGERLALLERWATHLNEGVKSATRRSLTGGSPAEMVMLFFNHTIPNPERGLALALMYSVAVTRSSDSEFFLPIAPDDRTSELMHDLFIRLTAAGHTPYLYPVAIRSDNGLIFHLNYDMSNTNTFSGVMRIGRRAEVTVRYRAAVGPVDARRSVNFIASAPVNDSALNAVSRALIGHRTMHLGRPFFIFAVSEDQNEAVIMNISQDGRFTNTVEIVPTAGLQISGPEVAVRNLALARASMSSNLADTVSGNTSVLGLEPETPLLAVAVGSEALSPLGLPGQAGDSFGVSGLLSATAQLATVQTAQPPLGSVIAQGDIELSMNAFYSLHRRGLMQLETSDYMTSLGMIYQLLGTSERTTSFTGQAETGEERLARVRAELVLRFGRIMHDTTWRPEVLANPQRGLRWRRPKPVVPHSNGTSVTASELSEYQGISETASGGFTQNINQPAEALFPTVVYSLNGALADAYVSLFVDRATRIASEHSNLTWNAVKEEMSARVHDIWAIHNLYSIWETNGNLRPGEALRLGFLQRLIADRRIRMSGRPRLTGERTHADQRDLHDRLIELLMMPASNPSQEAARNAAIESEDWQVKIAMAQTLYDSVERWVAEEFIAIAGELNHTAKFEEAIGLLRARPEYVARSSNQDLRDLAARLTTREQREFIEQVKAQSPQRAEALGRAALETIGMQLIKPVLGARYPDLEANWEKLGQYVGFRLLPRDLQILDERVVEVGIKSVLQHPEFIGDIRSPVHQRYRSFMHWAVTAQSEGIVLLGDYFGPGSQPIDTLEALRDLFLHSPTRSFFVRGNHEIGVASVIFNYLLFEDFERQAEEANPNLRNRNRARDYQRFLARISGQAAPPLPVQLAGAGLTAEDSMVNRIIYTLDWQGKLGQLTALNQQVKDRYGLDLSLKATAELYLWLVAGKGSLSDASRHHFLHLTEANRRTLFMLEGLGWLPLVMSDDIVIRPNGIPIIAQHAMRTISNDLILPNGERLSGENVDERHARILNSYTRDEFYKLDEALRSGSHSFLNIALPDQDAKYNASTNTVIENDRSTYYGYVPANESGTLGLSFADGDLGIRQRIGGSSLISLFGHRPQPMIVALAQRLRASGRSFRYLEAVVDVSRSTIGGGDSVTRVLRDGILEIETGIVINGRRTVVYNMLSLDVNDTRALPWGGQFIRSPTDGMDSIIAGINGNGDVVAIGTRNRIVDGRKTYGFQMDVIPIAQVDVAWAQSQQFQARLTELIDAGTLTEAVAGEILIRGGDATLGRDRAVELGISESPSIRPPLVLDAHEIETSTDAVHRAVVEHNTANTRRAPVEILEAADLLDQLASSEREVVIVSGSSAQTGGDNASFLSVVEREMRALEVVTRGAIRITGNTAPVAPKVGFERYFMQSAAAAGDAFKPIGVGPAYGMTDELALEYLSANVTLPTRRWEDLADWNIRFARAAGTRALVVIYGGGQTLRDQIRLARQHGVEYIVALTGRDDASNTEAMRILSEEAGDVNQRWRLFGGDVDIGDGRGPQPRTVAHAVESWRRIRGADPCQPKFTPDE